MKEYGIIRSKNKCPVCSSNKWYPLSDDVEPIESKYCSDIYAIIDGSYDNYVHFDQCVNCWTVVSG